MGKRQVVIKGEFSVGGFHQTAVFIFLKSWALSHGLTIRLEHLGGFLRRHYWLEMTGPEWDRMAEDYEELLRDLDEG